MENESNQLTDKKSTENKTEKKVETTEKDKPTTKKPNTYRKPRKNYSPNRRYYNKNSKNQAGSYKNSLNKFPFNKISILVPLFNEEESLTRLTKEINTVFESISPDYEILFIDDGSDDNSLKVIKNLVRTNNKIRYISFRKNYGKSAALNVGFKNVTGDVVITMDADLQDDPGEIPSLLKELQKGFDLVSGWKKKRHDPFIKKYSSRFFNYVTKVIFMILIVD